MPVTTYVDSKFNGLVTVAGLSGDVATVINDLSSTLATAKAQIVDNETTSTEVLSHLNNLETIVKSDVVTLLAKDGSTNNYQISTQGDGTNDALFISKGSVPLMEISTRSLSEGVTEDVVKFSVPIIYPNMIETHNQVGYLGKSYDVDIAAINFSTVFVGDNTNLGGSVNYRVKFSFNYGIFYDSRVYMEIYDANNNDTNSSNPKTKLVAELYNPIFRTGLNAVITKGSQPCGMSPISLLNYGYLPYPTGAAKVSGTECAKVRLNFNSDFTTITGGYIVFGNRQNINIFYPTLTTFTLSAGSSISTPIFKTLSVPFDWMTNSYVNPNLPLSLPAKADNILVNKPVPSVSTYPFLKWLVEEGVDFYNPYQIGELVRSMGVDYVQLWDFSINITLDTVRSYQYLKTCFDAYNVKLLGINTHFDDHYLVDATSDDNLSNPGVKGIAFKNAWDRQQALNVIKAEFKLLKESNPEYIRLHITTDIPFIHPTDNNYTSTSTDLVYKASRDLFIASAIDGLSKACDIISSSGIKILYENHGAPWTFSTHVLIDIFNGLGTKNQYFGIQYDIHNSETQAYSIYTQQQEGAFNPQKVNLLNDIVTIMPYLAIINIKVLDWYKGTVGDGNNTTGGFLYEDNDGNISNSNVNGGLKIPRSKDGPIETRYNFVDIYKNWRTCDVDGPSKKLSFNKFPIFEIECENKDLMNGSLGDMKQAYMDVSTYHRRAVTKSYV